MSQSTGDPTATAPEDRDTTPETPEVVPGPPADVGERNMIEEPAKIMRIGSMIKQLLDELRQTTLDTQARERLAVIYQRSLEELGTSLSPELCAELRRLTGDIGPDEAPTDAELRILKAQLVGWLEGLFQGIQATLIAQQMAARHQLDGVRGQLPPGGPVRPGPPPGGPDDPPGDRPGTYL